MCRWITLLSVLVAVAPGLARAERYTLEALVDRVSRQHPGVVAQRATVAMRKAQRLEQQLRWVPSGDARLLVTGAPDVRCIDSEIVPASKSGHTTEQRLTNCIRTNVVDLARSGPGTSLYDRAPIHAPLVGFGAGITQPLYTSGKIEAAIGAAKGGVAYEEGALARDTADLALGAIRVWTQIKASRMAIDAIETNVKATRDWRDRINAELDGRNAARFTEADVLRLGVHLVNLQTSILGERRNLLAALEALKALTDDPAADVDEAELAWTWGDVEVPAASVWQERMLADRAEVKWAQGGLAYYKAWRRLHLSFMLPDFAMITGIGAGYAPSFDFPTLGFAALPASSIGGAFGFAMRQPLDLGPKLLRWDSIRHEERMHQIRFRLGLRYWAFETGKAHLDFVEAKRRLDGLRQAEKITRGWYAAVDENLAVGLYTDGREILEVLNNWMSFHMRRASATQDTIMAMATLRRMSGQPLLGGPR
jgi:hypothetical protein